MNLKGDLDSIGLAELFQTLSSQRATGVLTVSGSFGEKLIAIAHGEIAVLSDKTAERVRLGDLLVARGKLTETQVQEALKIQRTSEQRSRLGDVLVKQGLIKPQDIAESLKFQLEEEIYELFTWKGASFEFNGDQSVDDAAKQESSDNTLQRMYIEPQQLISEASRRVADWQTIENRLPTPYLCFKMSPKGEELSGKAALATQQIVKLLKEGRTIETTVKKSCLGRFNVSKAIVKLLDEGWIFPYPASELRFLASEHRSHGRYSDALYVYRRMLEASPTESESTELQGLIDDTLDAIRRAQDAGESVEGTDTISFKQAAERYKRRQRTKRIASLVLSGIGLIGATFWVTETLRPPPGINEAYQEAYQKASDARRRQKYKEAVAIWQGFQSKLDRRSPTYQLVDEQIENLQLQDDAYLKEVMLKMEGLEATNLAEAESGYKDILKELMDKTPDSPHIAKIKVQLEHISTLRQKQAVEQQLANLKDQLAKAKDAFQQKKYTLARSLCVDISRVAPAGSPEDKEQSVIFKQLADIEAKSMQMVEQAKTELAAKKGEQAIQSFDAAGVEWPDLPSAEAGHRESQQLKRRLEQLKEDVAAADAITSRGQALSALERCQQIQRDYPEFELTLTVKGRIDKLQAAIAVFDGKIKDAQKLLADGKFAESRKMFMDLARENLPHLIARNVELPVIVQSFPLGATISIDGNVVGKTPKELTLPAGKAIVVHYELPGYSPADKQILRVGTEDLDLHQELLREAVTLMQFKPTILAPPSVVGKDLYVLHGTTLSVADPSGKSVQWTIEKLLDDTADTRPDPLGGPPKFVGDKTWWYPRVAPLPMANGKLLLPLRSRELIEIDPVAHTKRTILSTSQEPIGLPHVEFKSFLAGKTLLAVITAEGKIRTYDMDAPATPLWEKNCDKEVKAGEGIVPISGLSPRPNGSFASLSQRGHLAFFNIVNGEETGTIDVTGPLTEFSNMPDNKDENLAALVHKDGKVTVVDLFARERVWELTVQNPMEEAISALVGKDGIYIASRDSTIRKYPRTKTPNRPAFIWKRPMDGSAEVPMCLGKNLFAVANSGTVYAISASGGDELWRYPLAGKTPTNISTSGDFIYISTKEGQLLILNANQ